MEKWVQFWYKQDLALWIDNKDKIKKVMEIVNILDEKSKKIITMRFWDDLSFKEIWEIMGISEDSCKKILYRSLAKIDPSALSLFLALLMTTIWK
jgi:DNA-directed RNA polymerase specialized sigma subunit